MEAYPLTAVTLQWQADESQRMPHRAKIGPGQHVEGPPPGLPGGQDVAYAGVAHDP